MIVYTVKYFKRYQSNAESVYTSIFKSESGADIEKKRDKIKNF